MQQKRLATLTRRVFVVWDEKGLQRSSYHSVGYWNCLKTSRLIVRFVNPLLGNLVFLLLLKEKVHERLSFKLFSHQLLTTMKYNISKSTSQLEDDRQLMKTHGTNAWWCAKQAASRAPTYMKPGTEVLGMKGTSLRAKQQKTTLWDFRNHLPDKQPRNLSQAATQKGMKRGRLLLLKHKLLPHL